MKITWTVKFVSETTFLWDNRLAKVYIIIEEYAEKYPSSYLIDFIWDKTEQATRVIEGDLVTVQVNSRVSEYKGKHYGNLSWRAIKKENKVNKETWLSTAYGDDLPF